MKSPKLSLQFSRFNPQRTNQSLQIASTLSLEKKNSFLKKKKNENLEDETTTNNAFVKFLRLSNETQINNQRCLFFDWYIVKIFFFSSSVGYILLVMKTLNIQPCTCIPYPAPASVLIWMITHQNFHFLIGNTLNCTMNLKNPFMQLLSREYFFCSRRTLQASHSISQPVSWRRNRQTVVSRFCK